jgi:hypothetical protein
MSLEFLTCGDNKQRNWPAAPRSFRLRSGGKVQRLQQMEEVAVAMADSLEQDKKAGKDDE